MGFGEFFWFFVLFFTYNLILLPYLLVRTICRLMSGAICKSIKINYNN